jgi:hypothetical protein
VLLADKFIERAWTHARGKRRTIGALDFDIFAISEKILHEGNYGAPVTQAIVPASPSKQTGLPASRQNCLRHDLEIARRAS